MKTSSIIYSLAVVFLFPFVVSCSNKSQTPNKEGENSTNEELFKQSLLENIESYPTIEFLFEKDELNHTDQIPISWLMACKDSTGNYIKREKNFDYSPWCAYFYLIDQIATEWYHYSYALNLDGDNVLDEFIAGFYDIQPSLNLYINEMAIENTHPKLQEIIERVYKNAVKNQVKFSPYKGGNGRNSISEDILKDNPSYEGNGAKISFMATKHEPHSLVQYVSIDNGQIPDGSLYVRIH